MKKKIYQDRTDRDESIVYTPGFIHITSLESQLKTTTTHSEPHRIHIDMIGECSSVFRLCIRSYVSPTNLKIMNKKRFTVIFRVYISVPWDGGIDEWTRRLLVEEYGEVDSYLRTPSSPYIPSKGASKVQHQYDRPKRRDRVYATGI